MIRTLMTLGGNYKLNHLPYGADDTFVFEDNFVPYGWLDADVPEDVRTTLRRNGLISGHYMGKDLESERWIEEQDWLYYHRFWVDEAPDNTWLVCHGLDTIAAVYLNGKLLGRSDNMFLPSRFDVSSVIQQNSFNTLYVRIYSPIASLQSIPRDGLYPQEDTDRLLLRKAQMNYGWDFCGRCVTGGIWKPIELVTQQGAVLGDFHLRTISIGEGQAVLGLTLDAGDMPAVARRVRLRLASKQDVACEALLDMIPGEEISICVDAPKLWWPRPYGEPHLYEAHLQLFDGDTVCDEKYFRFGVRSIELRQDVLLEGGRSFEFIVNGRPIFVRGANWVPTRAVYGEITDQDYFFYLNMAEQANLSMLRVWGGGIYESELFYDLCDRKGIMVMQDFMLACGIFPQDDGFLQQVEQEVAFHVRQLRNRACIAVWSGDNELDQAYWWYDLESQFKTNRVNRVAVTAGVKAHDPYRPFIHSSPASPFEGEPGHDDPNSPLQGDMHIYLTRFHPESEYYYKKLLDFVPRFMSEYGFSSLPSLESYGRFNFRRIALDMSANPWLGELPAFGRLASDEETVYYTQFSHAQALKYWIEYMRSHRGVCGGSLYWKFNDPQAPNRENMLFPSLMSSVDFFGRPKLAFYYSRRAYEDVMLAFRESKQGELQVHLCNDTLDDVQGELMLYHVDALGSRTLVATRQARLPMDSNHLLASCQMKQEDSPHAYYLACFEGSHSLINRFFPLDIAKAIGVAWPTCKLSVRVVSKDDNGLRVEITNDLFAQDVVVDVPDALDIIYSDNAFCMDAGSLRTVTLRRLTATLYRERLVIQAANAARQIIQL